jgi:transcriptional regulator with XRE-family HTH domain
MPTEKQKRFQNQIRHYRRKRNLKLRQATKLVGLSSPSHLSHWEKGRKLPKLYNALKLSAIIGCPVELLFLDLFNSIRADIHQSKKSLIDK